MYIYDTVYNFSLLYCIRLLFEYIRLKVHLSRFITNQKSTEKNRFFFLFNAPWRIVSNLEWFMFGIDKGFSYKAIDLKLHLLHFESILFFTLYKCNFIPMRLLMFDMVINVTKKRNSNKYPQFVSIKKRLSSIEFLLSVFGLFICTQAILSVIIFHRHLFYLFQLWD